MTDAAWARLRKRIEQLQDTDPLARADQRRPEYLRDRNGELPDDYRVCGPGSNEFQYDSGLEIHEKDGYWEVNDYSQEWSSSYHATGRGLTLEDALADLEANEG